MTRQTQFTLRPRSRGFHLITDEAVRNLPPLPEAGLLHLFIQHTSAGLSVNENADPDVQQDLAAIFDHLVRERESYYAHTLEAATTTCRRTPNRPSRASASPFRSSADASGWASGRASTSANSATRSSGRRIVATVIG